VEIDNTTHVSITEGHMYHNIYSYSKGCGTIQNAVQEAELLINEKIQEGYLEKIFVESPQNSLSVYYRTDWHIATGYPKTYPQARKFVGFFLKWLVENELLSADFYKYHLEESKKCKADKLKGSELIGYMADSLDLWHLSELGNQFSLYYFPIIYSQDYRNVFSQYRMAYVTDNAKNYEKMRLILDKRLDTWKSENL
jgi:hypothetical protein